jgi:signal transduction histidine kinase
LNATTLHTKENHGLGILIAARDISEQKRTEKALQLVTQQVESQYHSLEQAHSESRAILDATTEAMLLLAPNGEVISFNRRFREFFPQMPNDLIHQSLDTLCSWWLSLFTDPTTLALCLERSLTDREESFSEDLLQHTQVRRDLELYSTPVRSMAEVYMGRLYLLRDVTQEHELERMKRDFVAEVAHELRTPLTSIKGFVDLMLDKPVGLSKEYQDCLEVMQESAQLLVALVNDLLDVSRIEAGKIDLEYTSVTLHPLIHHVLHSFAPLIASKHQHMEAHLEEPSPVVFANPERVRQIVSNLVSNAHKYTLEGGTLRISTQKEEQQVWVTIQDSGVGMTPEELARLFTRFFRAKNPLTKEIGGTGLGLVITHSLVALHGGIMQVESQPGQGSTFRFTLPLATESASNRLP